MSRRLSSREREIALAMIRHATPSPDEVDREQFTDEQKSGWTEPVPITQAQRELWARNLGSVVVFDGCECGTCPSIRFAPVDPEAAFDRENWSKRIVLDAGNSTFMLLLIIDDDFPTELELAPVSDAHSFSEFPPISTVRF